MTNYLLIRELTTEDRLQNNHVPHNMPFLPQIESKPSQRNYCYALSVLTYLEQKSSCSGCTAYSARGLKLLAV